jgi:S-formylglutathione hydrolase
LRFLLVALLAAACVVRGASAQSRLVWDSLHSAALEHNRLGDNATRRVLLYLPPSYDRSPSRRYPVLYFLHGFTSDPVEWVDGTYAGLNLQSAMDSLLAQRSIPEFIVVMPDANNRLGGGFYINSPVTGGWADFVVRDLVGYVDRKYRTMADRAHRTLAGHSMGGFGAVVLGFAHPERFGLLYSMSPCCMSFVGLFGPTSPAWAAAAQASTSQVEGAPAGTALVIAMAAALSPAPARARGYGELPFEPDSAGRLEPRNDIIARWEREMPAGLAHRMVEGGASRPRIYLEFGVSDVSSVAPGVAALRLTLDSLGVRYTVSEYQGGHIDRVRQRVSEQLLPIVGRWFGKAIDKR